MTDYLCPHKVATHLYCPSCVEDQLTKERFMEVTSTLQARGNRYGAFAENAAIADALQTVMQSGAGVRTNWADLDETKRQALVNISAKISRILSPSADPEYKDNWHDIQGYAKLGEDSCKD